MTAAVVEDRTQARIDELLQVLRRRRGQFTAVVCGVLEVVAELDVDRTLRVGITRDTLAAIDLVGEHRRQEDQASALYLRREPVEYHSSCWPTGKVPTPRGGPPSRTRSRRTTPEST